VTEKANSTTSKTALVALSFSMFMRNYDVINGTKGRPVSWVYYVYYEL
jgi:hypothetical protein